MLSTFLEKTLVLPFDEARQFENYGWWVHWDFVYGMRVCLVSKSRYWAFFWRGAAKLLYNCFLVVILFYFSPTCSVLIALMLFFVRFSFGQWLFRCRNAHNFPTLSMCHPNQMAKECLSETSSLVREIPKENDTGRCWFGLANFMVARLFEPTHTKKESTKVHYCLFAVII